MSFKLTELDEEVFQGARGDEFKVELTANRGAVQLLSARYGDQHTTANPAEFAVKEGVHDLIIVFQASNNDALVRLHELDGGQSQRLTVRPAFDATLSIEIRGRAGLAAAAKSTSKRARKAVKKAAKKAVKKEA